jgi:hypothetical protein
MTVRLASLALILTASAVEAAPAPLPKPDRDRPTQAQLLEELRGLGCNVHSIEPGQQPGTWVYVVARMAQVVTRRGQHLHVYLVARMAEGKDARAVLLALRAERQRAR